jgi:hypothetical protein
MLLQKKLGDAADAAESFLLGAFAPTLRADKLELL